MTASAEPANIEHMFGEPGRGTAAPRLQGPAAAGPWRVVHPDGSVNVSASQTGPSTCETPSPVCAGETTDRPSNSPMGSEQLTSIELAAQRLAVAVGPIDMPSPDSTLDVGTPRPSAARSARASGKPVALFAQSGQARRRTVRPTGAARVVETESPGATRGPDLDTLLSRSPGEASQSPPCRPKCGDEQSCRPAPVRRQPSRPDVSVAEPLSQRPETDAALARVVERWSALPRGIRAAVVAMVEAGAEDC